MGTMVFQVIYGVAMGFALFALIGVVLMTFCDKYKCRYLMYFSCFILFIFALISFLITIIFSIIIPIMYWGCDWLTVTISGSTGFNDNLDKYLDATTRGYITPCLSDGNGDIVNAAAPGAATTINNLTASLNGTNSFNFSATIQNLTDALNEITTSISGFNEGLVPDVTDTAALATFVQIANPANWAGCANLQGDSWAYSSNASGFAKCKFATAYKTGTECALLTDLTAYNDDNCKGCLDTNKILLTHSATYTTAGSWKSSVLDMRYGTGITACSNFNTYFGNVWDNYYMVKIPAIKAIYGRWDSVKNTEIANLITSFTPLNTTMNHVKGNLTNTVDSITNPTFGLIAGLNCKLIGEDINLLVNSICVSNFNTLYITRLALGIIAFGILFAMCCIVCSGVRHYKHSERKDKISPAFLGNTKNSFEDTDAAFKP